MNTGASSRGAAGRPGSGRRRARAVAGARLIAMLLAAVLPAGCGLKTPPRPASEVLPPTADLRVRQRRELALVSWPAPTAAVRGKFGGVREYRLLIARLPLFCEDCPPGETGEIAIAPDSPRLLRDGGRLHYPLPLGEAPQVLHLRVVTVFGAGANAPGAGVLLRPLVDIPAHRLDWEWAGGRGVPLPGGHRSLRLFWERRRERFFHAVGPAGRPEKTERFYRVNLYRRLPPRPWPLIPLNPQPLESSQWTVPPFSVAASDAAPGTGAAVEYTLRLVDQFGSEGPPAPPVTIPLSRREQ